MSFLEVAVAMPMIVLLMLVTMLVSVVVMRIGSLGILPKDGNLAAPHK